jgi:uncharacterized protein YycO
MNLFNTYISLTISFFLLGCIAQVTLDKPAGGMHQKQNTILTEEISRKGQNGDWLVIRGYHSVDDIVSNVTGIPLSHVGVLNADSQTVIEAEGKGVHESSLLNFIDKSHRILLIRPKWSNENNKNTALAKAQILVGKKYDFLGTIGFNFPDKFYCSELAVFIYKEWHDPSEKLPAIIKPGELFLYGKIIFDSLPRDEMGN